MGYAQATIVFYGIMVDYERAKELQPKIYAFEEMSPLDTMPENINLGYGENCNSGEVHLMADGADSRIDMVYGCFYPEESDYQSRQNEFQYAFGVFIASKGYAYNNNIVKAIKNEPSEIVKAIWDKHCAPLIKANENKPEVIEISQVW